MTYRERRLAKAERLREWSDKRATRAASTLNQARQMADAIPFGQPILVGHHSEKRDRAYRARIDSKFTRAFEDDKKAREMGSRADGIEAQAERAIYNDDPDAIERLREKLADLEAGRERMKEVNKLVRRLGFEKAAPELTEAERNELLTLARLCPYHQPLTRGFPAYALQNLGGNITRARQRLQILEGKPARIEASRDGDTATSRAGLRIIAGMTTPSRPGKKPRPVWNVTGAIGEWRQMLIGLDGRWYRGAFSFFDDPTAAIEEACAEAERPPADPVEEVAREIETREATAAPLADVPFSLTSPIGKGTGKQEELF